MPVHAKVSAMNVTLQTWTLDTFLAWDERRRKRSDGRKQEVLF
jgi:hypothetical protein